MAKIRAFNKYYDEYENWFIKHEFAYLSEIEALKTVIVDFKDGIEIGIGSGLFAKPIGIGEGIEPSAKMRAIGEQRGLHIIDAVAESLPYTDNSKDFALMVTTICFVDSLEKSFREAYRVLKKGGDLVLGFVDKDSEIGNKYLNNRGKSKFYKEAVFYGTSEILDELNNSGFTIIDIYQTLFNSLDKIDSVEMPIKGYGKGSFVVIRAEKSL